MLLLIVLYSARKEDGVAVIDEKRWGEFIYILDSYGRSLPR